MELKDFMLEIMIGLALGYVLGQVFLAWQQWREAQRLPTEAEDIQHELDLGHLIPLTVEVAGSDYLCYNSITNDFVCQGQDLEEIVQRFKARYPDKNAAIHRGNSEAVAVLKAQLKARNENRSSI